MFFQSKKDFSVTQWLSQFEHPLLPSHWLEQWVRTYDNEIKVILPFVNQSLKSELRAWMHQNLPSEQSLSLRIVDEVATLKATSNQRVKGVKNTILVSSAKGGVGKSTTAVNLALAMHAEGAKVGILDADIYGPSVPHLLATKSAFPESPDGKNMHPIEAMGIYSHSMGYLVPEEDAAIWRGPMASKALQQILNETLWPDLDYLIVDMPPGTGDIQLTIAQQFPVTGALIVTTPQDLALIDAKKGVTMFEKLDIPVLGIIENMSTHICEACGHQTPIFGDSGASKLASTCGTKVLGQLPLHMDIRRSADDARPIVNHQPEHPIALQYRELAQKVASQLYFTGKLEPESIAVRQLTDSETRGV